MAVSPEGWLGMGCGGGISAVGRGEGCDLGEVVGEDAVAAPDPGTGESVEAGAVQVVTVFEVADAAFAAGSPFDQFAEGWSLFVSASAGAGGALAGDGDVFDAQVVEVFLDA